MANTDANQQKDKVNTSILSGELAQKIADGNKSAEGEFVGLNYRWLLFVVRGKFSKSNNHEDIVQDTFMLVIKKLKQGAVNNPKAILGFMRTVAIQIGYDYLRKDKKFTSDVDPDLMETFKDQSEQVLSSMIWRDKLSYVKQAIDGLKIKRDQEILNQFYFEDKSKKSICEEFGLKAAHFDRVIFRAKDRLKQLIAKKGGYDDDDPKRPKGQLRSFDRQKSTNNNQPQNINKKNMLSKIFYYLAYNLKKVINPMVSNNI